MVKVPAGVGHPGVQPGDPMTGLLPVLGAPVLAGHVGLGTAQRLLPLPQPTRVVELLPGGEAAKLVRPRSTPTAASTAGSGTSQTSTTKQAWQRPTPSNVILTLDGSAGRGRDQRTLRSPIFRSDSLPWGRTRKRLLAVNRTA